MERGLRAGEALGYSEEELETFLDEAPPQPPTLAAGARLDDPQEAVDQLLEFIGSYDSFRFTALLDSLWSQKGPIECMAYYIAPLVQQVGDLWHEGKMHIRNEHFMTERISDYLRAARLPLEARAQGPRVILATLPGEIHGLGLQMAALTLAVAGARPVLLGTDIPLEEIYEAAMQQNARAVMISSSLHAPDERTISLLRELRDLLPHYVGLFTGGQGAPAVRGIEHFSTLFELDYFTRSRLLAL
jgi:methanogenic corrinoid protein MtbC1